MRVYAKLKFKMKLSYECWSAKLPIKSFIIDKLEGVLKEKLQLA